MRLIMMGTGPFAVPTFRRLLDSKHTVAALFTRPPRTPPGRKTVPVNPMRQVAEEQGLLIVEPESINTEESRIELARLSADLMVVCDYGQILSSDTLSVTRYGGINLHASLLPKYRGAAPINWAIFHGETETGVTVIHMTPKLDAGPCLVQHRMPIDTNDTALEVEMRLAQLGAPAVEEAIALLTSGGAGKAGLQDAAQATQAPRLKKTDGLVDWTRSAEAIRNQVRAMQPWPKTYTFWTRTGHEPLRLILEQVTVQPQDARAEPGVVVETGDDRLIVACGRGSLALDQLQPAGKRVMMASEFLRGYGLKPGDRLQSSAVGGTGVIPSEA